MNPTTRPLLSIIIPAYNEEKRLPATLAKIAAFLNEQPYIAEVLVVENGSTDRTAAVALEFCDRLPNLRVLVERAAGKGLAVRDGMLKAVGEYRFVCDADLSMPIEQVNRFLPPSLQNVQVAIASRELPGSVRYDEPAYRHSVGRIFNTLVRVVALPGLQDTQAGFKLFRADVAEAVFPLQTMQGWAFDVEVLFIARRLGYCIQEVPIDWYFDSNSKIKVARDSIAMFRDLVKIRLNALKGRYHAPARA
jgi:glycosyltransferase involved in cell wall biosynthesis